MDRTEKTAFIGDLNQKVSASSVVLVAHYKGLTVSEITDLRVKVKNIGAGFKVTKNKLTQRALEKTLFEPISKMFVGPTAIAYSSDPVAVAKVLAEFAKANEKLVLLGGAFGETLLDAKGVVALSKMPSLYELRAKIVALIQTPARRIATLLQAPGGQVARVIGAHSRKGEAA
jgi:large subunit ribosomal protein L10